MAKPNKRNPRKTKPMDPRGKRVYTRDGEDFVKNKVSERRGEMRDEMSVNDKYNDWTWYAKNEHMLQDAASFSYNNPLGNQLPFLKLFPSATLPSGWSEAVPGLYSMRYVACPGVSISSTSPVNLAAQNIYTYVRYMNSGAKNYDPADIMLYLMTMDSIYYMWNWAKRIYGYSRTYSQKNRYLPTVMAAADGVNLQSVVQNLADYRYKLNELASRISSFCVPAVMPLFIRHSWMASNIYKDSDSAKAQMYMFTPDIYYTYDETGSSYGGRLVANQVKRPGPTSSAYTYTDIVAVINTMLDAIAYSEDIGVMSGDILKAYGQEKLFKLTPVDAEYTCEPVYNEEVLNQIHNSRMSPISNDLTQLNITQDPVSGYLLWNPTLAKDVMQVGAVMINMPWDDVTPANTMVASRLTSMQTDEDKFACVGSEFIDARIIFTQTPTGGYQFTSIGNYVEISYKTGTTPGYPQSVTGLLGFSQTISRITQFDWHPLMCSVVVDVTEEVGKYYVGGMVGDVNNYTIIDNYSMEQLHQAALLSEFNVPQIGSF